MILFWRPPSRTPERLSQVAERAGLRLNASAEKEGKSRVRLNQTEQMSAAEAQPSGFEHACGHGGFWN